MKREAPYSAAAPRGWMPRGWLAPILCIVLVAVPDAVATFALAPFHLLDAHENPLGVGGWSAFLLVTFGAMALVFLGWVRLVERRPLATIGLTGARPLRTFLVGGVVGVGGVCAIVAAIAACGGYRAEGIARAFASPRDLLGIALLLPCFAVQSSVEEVIFRGWLLSGIARRLNVPIAVALSSATFALLHYERGQAWPVTAAIVLFSVFACAWSLRAGNVWGAMGWHTTWNWLLAVGFELPVTALRTDLPALLVRLRPVGSALLTGGAQGPEGSPWCSAFFLAGLAWIGLAARRGRRTRAVAVAPATA